MAIRRCPYCKAIIDESSEYCSNCGTRLLFPEDEFIEEEIPGEKIIDEELKEEKPKLSGRNSSKKEESKLEEKDEDNTELKEDEGELADSKEASEEIEELAEPEEPVEEEKEAKIEEKKEERHPKEEKEEIGEPLEESEMESEERSLEEKEEESQKEFAFKTEELEKMVDPAEKEKQEIERFLESIKKEREEKAVSEEGIPPDSSEIEERTPEAKDELPPWAEKIKESPPAVEAFSEEEEAREEPLEMEEELPAEAEEPYEEVAPIPDSGVGIPEGVDQKSLPFDNEKREKIRGIKIKPPSELSVWLKSKVFDLLFIGVIWIVALWFASRVMAVPLFKLISASVHSVVIFYLVLLISYFSLFLYFLGETLGEHLFSKQE